MNRFDSINPMDYRYIPQDDELTAKIKEYCNLDVFSKIKRAVPEIVIPRLHSLEAELLSLAEENKDKTIPRRVDGKHKGKINLGEVFTSYAERLRSRTQDIGEISLNFQNLDEARQNDIISDLVYFSISAFSVEANISNDIRHLFRSEIGEFSHELFEDERIGSSTMPHKKNPAEYEQIVSLWKEYLPRLISAVLCQVVEHQGDTTSSELPDYVFEMLCGLGYATNSLEKALKNLKINV